MTDENKLFTSIKPYVVWMIIWLFYFAVSAHISVLLGLYHALLFTSLQFLVFILNQKFLIPKYFERDKRKFYLKNLLILLILSGITAVPDYVLSDFLFSVLQTPIHWIFLLSRNFIFGFIALWISISQYLLEKEKITKIEIEELKRDRAESELKFLKMQINPHFLFNALNNVYIMTYTGDKSAADKIAMLSNMLRYVLYDCKSDLISIEKEVEYINNFIEFQQLKTEKKQNITFVTSNIAESSMIAPMLLIPFIENGFKHSRIEKNKDGYVNIKLSIIRDKIHFNIKNSLPEIPVKSSSNIDKGIGIENVKNRLELLYPGKYSLDIKSSGKEFQVTLELFTIDDRK